MTATSLRRPTTNSLQLDAAAQPAHPRRLGRQAAGAARRARHRQVDALADRQPVDALQHQPQGEAQFQLDDDRRLVAAAGDEVAAIDLALDHKAAALEEPFDRPIKRRFAQRRGSVDRTVPHLVVPFAAFIPAHRRLAKFLAAAAKLPSVGLRTQPSYAGAPLTSDDPEPAHPDPAPRSGRGCELSPSRAGSGRGPG